MKKAKKKPEHWWGCMATGFLFHTDGSTDWYTHFEKLSGIIWSWTFRVHYLNPKHTLRASSFNCQGCGALGDARQGYWHAGSLLFLDISVHFMDAFILWQFTKPLPLGLLLFSVRVLCFEKKLSIYTETWVILALDAYYWLSKITFLVNYSLSSWGLGKEIFSIRHILEHVHKYVFIGRKDLLSPRC